MSAVGSTFESHEPLLKDILADIHRGKVQLPDFQRPWVWPDNHIAALLASVSLAYPIGAVMLLQTGGAGVRFRPRAVHGVQLEAETAPERLILDGQQRLTSLYGSLWSGQPIDTKDDKNKAIRRLYYFDIEKCLDINVDREDAVLSVPESRQLKSNFGRDIELDLQTQASEFEHGMVPAACMLEPTAFPAWRMSYMAHHGYDKERIEKITAFEREIWMRFQHFKVPVIQLLKTTPKEAVCQVFEKVNTGGVALSVFELMTATFAADDFQLVQDWETRKARLHEHEVLRAIKGRDFLQTVTLLSTFRQHRVDPSRGVTAKKRAILALELEDYLACADDVEQGLLRAARLLARECVFDRRNLPYTTQLIPLGVVCAHLGKQFEEDAARRKLTRWYWCGVFGEMYGGANESRYANDVVELCAWIADEAEPPRTVRNASFSPLRILSLQTRQSAAYKGAMALMVQRGSHDFINGDPIAHTQGFSLPVDVHHIFPKAWSEANEKPRRLYNCIANKAPLTAATNRTLGGKAPSIYLDRIVARGSVDAETLNEMLATHYIQPQRMHEDDFEGFLLDRTRRLLDRIEEVTGNPIEGREAESIVEAFGGPLTWSTEEKQASQPKVKLYEHYEVVREIATGGMSTVICARDLRDQALVCLKRVPTRGAEADALMREMQIYDRLARRDFAHSLEVFGVERDDISISLVTAWADGGTLEDFVEDSEAKRLLPKDAQAIGLTLLAAVAELHALDVVHRDIKPANLLQHQGAWKLADFGIAKNTSRLVTRATMQQRCTPGYAPPEQFAGRPAHPSMDIYALGKVLVFMLSGETDPDRITLPGWRELVADCSKREPDERPSIEAVAARLGAILV